ncbi:MAG TPA: ROK family protein [bacterium]|nr:ROK family protein [bacterium]
MPSYSIALDVGATKTVGATIINQKIINSLRYTTNASAPKIKIIKQLEQIIFELSQQKEISGYKLEKIGIGLAGQIDAQNGLIMATTNFNPDFKNVKLSQILSKKFKVPVFLNNDVKCFTKAEATLGLGRGFKNIVGLTFGTGIGGGIILNNLFLTGKNNTVGEIGHMKIAGHWLGTAPVCGCGQKYCFEAVASAKAWLKLSKKFGEKKADEIICYNIGIGLSNLAQILNPEIFILGGRLMKREKILMKIKQEFLNQVKNYPWLKNTKIVATKLGSEAILLGSLMSF